MNTWKVVEKFRARDFLLDGAPRSGRPVEVDSDQIETLIENNQCDTMQEIANILKISEAIKLLIKMKNMSFILWKKLNDSLADTIESEVKSRRPSKQDQLCGISWHNSPPAEKALQPLERKFPATLGGGGSGR